MKKLRITAPEVGNQISEAYKALRTNLQFCGDDIKVVDITSCTPDEGKSTVSFRLAQALAETGKNTILVDADMRKSVMMNQVRPEHGEVRGLSHYLSGQSTLEDVVYSTDMPKLYMILSGKFPPNPAELLGGRRFKSLVASLREAFDYVIIDTPPLMNVIDSAVVAGNCDGVILVIEQGVIDYRFAQDVTAQLDRTGCPILGTVLNKVDARKDARYYGRYYGKYYGKYYGRYGKYGGYGEYGNNGENAGKQSEV